MALNENAKKWVAALRSGEFKQGKYVLHQVDTDSYCCLGVGCKVAMANGVQLETGTIQIDGKYEGVATRFDCEHTFLPKSVKDWLGLTSSVGCSHAGYLTELNDSGKTFSKIADLIESEPPGLFVKEGE